MKKSLIIWLCIIIIPFIAFVALLYLGHDYILKYMNKSKEPVFTVNQSEKIADSDSVDSVSNVMRELLKLQEENIAKIKAQDLTIKQQKKEIERLKALNETIKQQNKQELSAEKQKRIQDLARTLGSMKQDVIRPILANLPDNILKLIYDQAKSKDRPKIFNSMPPERAGRLMQKLAAGNTNDK